MTKTFITLSYLRNMLISLGNPVQYVYVICQNTMFEHVDICAAF